MANKQSKLTFVIDIDNKGKIKIDGIKSNFSDLEKKIKSATTSTDTFNKKNVDLIATSGLAGATLTEVGRTVSDFNYGIRGMANNLSQLSTLFITLIGKAGGFRKALSILGTQLMGPMGRILAFQAAITIIEAFSMKQDKAKKSTDGLTEALGRQAQRFIDFQQGLGRYNTDLEKTEDIVKVMSNRFPEFKKLVEGLGDKPSRENLEALIAMYTDFLLTQDKLTKKEKELSGLRGEFFKIPEAERTKNISDKFFADSEKLKGQIFDLELRIAQFKDVFEKEGGAPTPPEFIRKQLEALNPFFEKFFFDINKKGEIVFKSALEDVEFTASALAKSALEATDELEQMGERYDDHIKRLDESAKAGIKAIKNQAAEIQGVFSATQKSLGYLNDVFSSYNNARMEALARERDYILNSGRLTGAAQKKALEEIEKKELKAQERKIKSERDMFTIKQSLLIAEEIMRAKAFAAEQIRTAQLAVEKGKATAQQIALDSVSSIGAANMSIGAFVKALGPYGTAAFAISIGGIIASIVAARKKASSAIAALGAPSTGGGGGLGVEAPDFNVVGASPESQLAQSVSRQQTQPLRAFVVNKDIKDAEELDRTIDFNRSLG